MLIHFGCAFFIWLTNLFFTIRKSHTILSYVPIILRLYGRIKMIQKINRMTLVEQVVEQIEQLIEQGKWKVGDKLPPEMERSEERRVGKECRAGGWTQD